MKWVKFKDEIDSKISSKERKSFFEGIPPILPSNSKEKGVTDKDGFSNKIKAKMNNMGFVEWGTYPEQGSKALPKLGKRAVRKYEIFCGGFLYYHDVEFKKYAEGRGFTVVTKGPDGKEYPEVKVYPAMAEGSDGKEYPSKNFEHKIFFEWLPKGNVRKDKVRIYINATPEKLNSNPPKPPGPPPPESNG